MDFSLPPLPSAFEQVNTNDIVQQINQCQSQKSSDFYISILLNTLSLAVYNHLYPDRSSGNPAIIYSATSRIAALAGDVFRVRSKPEIIATSGGVKELEGVLARLMVSTSTKKVSTAPARVKTNWVPSWVDCISPVGVNQQADHSSAEIESHCISVKRYRQDLSRVFGLQGNTEIYRVISLDPRARKESKWYSWRYSNVLIRYLIGLYHLETSKDTKILIPINGSKGHLWRFDDGSGMTYDVVPFYAASNLGRMTWVAIGGQSGFQRTDRVLKVSWLNKTRLWNEKEQYDHAHRDGWIPGLARPVHYLQTDDKIPDDTTRERCMLMLGSTGQPLSECDSVFHFLKVMYDLIETHQHMCEKGVLHRDISWGNVLCNPKHDTAADKKPVLSRPCISKILGEANPQSSVLLTDLDNSARVTYRTSGNEAHGIPSCSLDSELKAELKKCTGTPMFIAMDIASSPIASSSTSTTLNIDLLTALRPKDQTSFGKAFPDGDGDFMLRFTEVCLATWALATERNAKLRAYAISGDLRDIEPSQPRERPVQHEPWHDIESVYWIIVWWLGRAQPVSSTNTVKGGSELREKKYQFFCSNLLNHEIGAGHETELRGIYRPMAASQWALIVDPGLAFLTPMLECMGTYLSIDWYLHGSIINKYHAHNAFRRLLLNEILKLKDEDPIRISGKPRKCDAAGLEEASSSLATLLSLPDNPRKRSHEALDEPRQTRGKNKKMRMSERPVDVSGKGEDCEEKDEGDEPPSDSEGSGDSDFVSNYHKRQQATESPHFKFRGTALEDRRSWFGRGC